MSKFPNLMSKRADLEKDVSKVEDGIKNCIEGGLIVGGDICESRLDKNGYTHVRVAILLRELGQLVTKYITFAVIGNRVILTLPMVGLCEQSS